MTDGTEEPTGERGEHTARYVALLRGINVGGHRRVPMAELRQVLAGLGHRAPVTHLQSGNAVFGAPRGSDPGALARELAAALERRFGFAVDTLVLGAAELRAVAARCPYDTAALDPAKLLVFFLDGPPDRAALARVDPGRYAPGTFRTGAREVFAYFPDGMGRSRLADALTGALKGHVATARNWRTVTKLLELAGEEPG
ncbi:DUF1697 domain-containing protein [Streptomyces sp. NPDC059853]|uniref:DUF1697 domain-containing protein n=1 Tax=Streptomyces sp. NPDC059853 TaxID=3346973 RepID=UPI0036543720